MPIAFRLFVTLIVLTPAVLFFDSAMSHGLLTLYAALMLLVIAVSIRPGEAGFFFTTVSPFVWGALAVSVVIILQLIPLPFDNWRHPIWTSAATALGGSVWGSISIAPGDTLLALVRWLTVAGLFVAATAAVIDRVRAELFLFTLLGLSVAGALVLVVHNLGGFEFLGPISSTGPRAAIASSALIAATLSVAMLVFAVERYETRHSRADFGRLGYVAALVAGLLGLLIALVTILLFMSKAHLLAALMGIGTFLLIIGFRRAGVSPRFGALIPIAALGIPALFAAQMSGAKLDLALRFAADGAAPLLETVQHMLADTGSLGSGAGTFTDFAALYADPAQQAALATAPTFMAGMIVNFGRPLTWLLLAVAVAGIVRLIFGALTRGRDSFFTAAAASCLVAILVESFIDAALFHSTTLILLTAVTGLGVAQSTSRSAR